MKELLPNFDESVAIQISKAAAIVLFDYLQRSDEQASARKPRPLPDRAELRAFDELNGKLESTLVESFAPNYHDIVAQAKKRLTDL